MYMDWAQRMNKCTLTGNREPEECPTLGEAVVDASKIAMLTATWMLSLFCSTLLAQRDSLSPRTVGDPDDIRLLFSFYDQRGNHSAITGGTGSENLQVYALSVVIDRQVDSVRGWTWEGGIDHISSASTDAIDFNLSSASRKDNRVHIQGRYRKQKGRHELYGGARFSLESDYLSAGLLGGYIVNPQKPAYRRGIYWAVYWDDLRWGRLNEDENFRPARLVYPKELRKRDSLGLYRRYSVNLTGSWAFPLDNRSLLYLYPGVISQQGLLSTPFHRVILTGGTSTLERLPNRRWQLPLGAELSRYLNRQWIASAVPRYVWDSFGAHSVTLKGRVTRIWNRRSASLFVRLYRQQSAYFFAPTEAHTARDRWLTSDYDLSRFSSWKTGVQVNLQPWYPISRKKIWASWSLRLAYYRRSDGLSAWMLSSLWGGNNTRHN